MEDLVIKMTAYTPEIIFRTNGDLSLKGVSIPENTFAFFADPLEWIKEFEKSLPKKITLNLEFEYLNTASNRAIIDLIRIIENYGHKNKSFVINWIYDEQDEDARELGEDIEFCVESDFNYVPGYSRK